MFSSALILIPARNEEASVAKVIKAAIEHTGCKVLLIDDASTDATSKVAREAGAIVLPLSARLGAWGGLQAGMRYARREGYRFVITMDADGQHEAADLEKLFTPLYREEANVAIGACVSRGSRLRKVAWVLLKWISGLTMEDITSGFRAYDKAAINILSDKEATLLEYQDIGVLALLKRNRLRITEVQVDMCPRTTGHSRVYSSWVMVGYYMLQASILGFSKRGHS